MVNSHIMTIPANGKREATVDGGIIRLGVWILQVATRQHGLLRIVEGDRAKLLPIADDGFVLEDLMNGDLALTHAPASVNVRQRSTACAGVPHVS